LGAALWPKPSQPNAAEDRPTWDRSHALIDGGKFCVQGIQMYN
jgi:hypothetical protein